MTETPENAVARAEAAATRRRWISLAEFVGVAGLLIAGISLWMTWSDRRQDERDRVAARTEQASESKAKTLVLLTGDPQGGGERLSLRDAAHPVQSVDIRFPAALGISSQTSVLDPRIEAKWVSDRILTLTDKGPDARQGRLPVLITSSYWDGDQQRRDTAIYDIVWQTEPRFLRGRAFRLKGLLLRERTGSAARLEAAWVREKPAAMKG